MCIRDSDGFEAHFRQAHPFVLAFLFILGIFHKGGLGGLEQMEIVVDVVLRLEGIEDQGRRKAARGAQVIVVQIGVRGEGFLHFQVVPDGFVAHLLALGELAVVEGSERLEQGVSFAGPRFEPIADRGKGLSLIHI